MPSCHGRGSAAQAAAVAAAPRTASTAAASIRPAPDALSSLVTRTMRPPPPIPLHSRAPRSEGRVERRSKFATLAPRPALRRLQPPAPLRERMRQGRGKLHQSPNARQPAQPRPNPLRQAAAGVVGACPAAPPMASSADARPRPYWQEQFDGVAHDRPRPDRRLVLRAHRHGPEPYRGDRRRGAARHGRRRIVSRIQPVREPRARRRPHQERQFRHDAGVRSARGCRRGSRLCPRLRTFRGGDPARRGDGAGGGERPLRHDGAAAARHQPHPLHRREPAGPRRSLGQDPPSRGNRRLRPQPRSARQAGHGLAERRVAGRPDRPRRRQPRRRHPPAGAARCRDRRRRRRPHGDRLLRRRRPRRPTIAISIRSNGRGRSTRRCARLWSIWARCRRRPAR